MTILSFIAGAAIALQSTMSGQLGHLLKNPLWATYSIYFVSTILMSFIMLTAKVSIPTLNIIKSVPKYLWFSGSLLSVFALTLVYWQMPKIGVARVMSGVLAGQIIVSVIAAHFGWFQLPITTLTIQKCLGAFLLIIGVILINGKTVI